MPDKKLTKYDDQLATNQVPVSEYPDSGVKSPNSDREMKVVLPLERHPQLKGMYKAIDPGDEKTKPWIGWVKFEPETQIQQKQELKEPETALRKYNQLLRVIRKRVELIQLGIITESESGLSSMRNDAKNMAKIIGEIE